MAYKVAIDAGHGGSDPGAVYGGRREKDDVLRLANAVGKILEDNGVEVFYVRNGDEYETPFKKATDANNAGADYFISIHRNSSEYPNQYSGVQTLVFNDAGIKATMARNINAELEKIGYQDLGVDERPNLVVLKRTQMPAVLVEAGFINSEKDNKMFDDNFQAIAQGIADGVLTTLNVNRTPTVSNTANELEIDTDTEGIKYDPYSENIGVFPGNSGNMNNYPTDENEYNDGNLPEKLYRVQVGAYRNKESADRLLNSLLIEGFPAFVIFDGDIYRVQVGAFRMLANAIKMEERLRRFRYNTYITV